MAHPFYTIGHSTRTIEDFADMLMDAGVTLVADVRSVPFSRANPQYNKTVLPQALSPYAIAYEHIPALGGFRGKSPDIAQNANAFWENDRFRNYADYAMGEEFRAGLARLQELGYTQSCAIMCAEALWWKCHRRIIADYLLAAGERVWHIVRPENVQAARMTEGARVMEAGVLLYPSGEGNG